MTTPLYLEPAAPDLFFSKNDKGDLRLGDLFKPLSTGAAAGADPFEDDSFVIIGYPDDEGIQLNGGRVGAAQGPDAIRRALYKMTPSMRMATAKTPLGKRDFFDAGNLQLKIPLVERHVQARNYVRALLERNAQVIALGGGHDYGYADMGAFCEYTLRQQNRPFIINFDAHLDVRPDTRGANSGTPFYRLLSEFAGKIDFFEVGVQDWCNAQGHFDWAQRHGARIVSLDKLLLHPGGLNEALMREVLCHVKPHHRLAVSVDIDCFSSSVCPGASQVFPTGFMANDFLGAWRDLICGYRPAVTGLYEVSPPFDLDQRTSRMAALLVHQRLFAN